MPLNVLDFKCLDHLDNGEDALISVGLQFGFDQTVPNTNRNLKALFFTHVLYYSISYC